ncbi:MAG: carbonic anhydrase [Pirellula sp.]|nr:carbonic anhydrase [Pirellula sp.]
MNSPQWTRRGLFACAAAAAVSPVIAAEPTATSEPFPETIPEAIDRLKRGNARFAAGKTHHAHESADWRKHLVAGQQPFATILGCADSRVPVELVFDQGFGDLFVVRVAGNVIAPDVVGSLEYAAAHLSTPVIVVLGHQSCGAVTAALASIAAEKKELPGIQDLVKLIKPGLPKDLASVAADERVNVAVEANVRWSMLQLAGLPEAKRAIDAGRIAIIGAVYELTTGRVRFLGS